MKHARSVDLLAAAAVPETPSSAVAPAASVVEIWTDGACKGNPGPGGWGALLRSGGKEEPRRFAVAESGLVDVKFS